MRTIIICTVLACAATVSAEPIAVGDRACLFLDDHFIAEQSGLTRAWHQGKPHPKAVINEEHPWEHWICLWGSCFYDPQEKIYRMYYQSTLYPSGVPGVSFMDYVCYAESTDGINWVKPKLGLVEFRGSKENNIIFQLAGVANAFVDPQATDPSERLKMFLLVLKGTGALEGLHDYACVKSADGIHWTKHGIPEKPSFAVPEQGNYVDGWQVNWDPVDQRWLGNFRCFSTGNKLAEKKNGQRRAVGVSFSDRLLKKWSPAALVIAPDDADDKIAESFSQNPDKPDWTEHYCMPFWRYGNHFLGFVSLFSIIDSADCNGGGNMQLAYSHDTLKWHRPEPRFAAIAPGDDPELRPTFAQFNPPLDMGSESWVYYCDTNGPHGVTPFDKSRGRIVAAVWRKDGFASMDCADKGTIVTKPIVFDGSQLLVNYTAQEGGHVRVALLDEKDTPIGQFDLSGCIRLNGDNVAHRVHWAADNDVSKFAGKPVRLMFELEKSRLWSFRFAK